MSTNEEIKKEEYVLQTLKTGATIRGAAYVCKVSTKTVQKIKNKHRGKFPKKEEEVKEKLPKKIAGVRRWITVPLDVDENIVIAADCASLTWQEQCNLILAGWNAFDN